LASSIRKGSISRPFSYIKRHHDNYSTEGQCYNAKDNEKG
jgi:hypothetical protein